MRNIDTDEIKERLARIETMLGEITKHYVTKEEFKPVRLVVYGFIGIVLTGVLGSILTGIFQ